MRNRVSKHFLTEKNSRLPLDKGRRLPYHIDIHQYGTRNPLQSSGFLHLLDIFQNKKLSERTASALLAECADDDIDDQTDRGCDRVDRALLTARLCLGIILLVLLLTASADHAVADLLQDCQRGERGKQQQEQSLNRLHLSG